MREVLITSSVLILALLALRGIFRRTLSRRVQYALWGLVALRLLVPLNLPAAQHSVLSAAEPVRAAITERMESSYGSRWSAETPAARPGAALPSGTGTAGQPAAEPAAPGTTPVAAEPSTGGDAAPVTPAASPETPEESGAAAPATVPVGARSPLTAGQILTGLWLAGAAVMALWFLLSNLRFARFLRRERRTFAADCPLPVYLVEEGLPSPCLAGLLHPAVYLTPAVAADERRLRHVLAHELTHARHLDPLWSLLRCLCLTVYWFDPLVWIAAHVSRSDCELACDEGALRRLGEDERIPYGETLLSLIPVGRPDPMLSATTMTAGKRQLRERIRRIASQRRPAAAAVFAVLCAAAILFAATFTGAVSPAAQGKADGVLSGAEIEYFNREFFNHGLYLEDADDPAGIRNHFLTCDYESPEAIDLCQLFYCGVPVAADDTRAEELRLAENGPDAACPTDILPVSAMDAVLLQYTGLTLSETRQVGLDQFGHPEEGYYTHTHGDTNALSEVVVSTGFRDGDTVVLYYTTAIAPYDWHRVTLQEQADGSFQFRANLPCEMPAIAPRLPETEPVLTLSLEDAKLFTPGPAALTHRSGDCAERGDGLRVQGGDGKAYEIQAYRSTDGELYVAVLPGNRKAGTWEADGFLTVSQENGGDLSGITLGSFANLFDRSGFTVGYSDSSGSYTKDYYYLPVDGTPYLMLRTSSGISDWVDLDGDGKSEFYSSDGQFAFLRDGQIYQTDLKTLLQEAWPQMDFWDWAQLDRNYRHLTVSGTVQMPGWGDGRCATFRRYLYYSGGSILVYKELQNVTYTDRLASTVNVPSDVATAAKALALDIFNQVREQAHSFQADDWRVDAVTLIETIPLRDGRSVEVYEVSSSCHTPDPGRLGLAGGAWVDEEGWFRGVSDHSPYLTFVVDGGKRVLAESDLPDDCSPGTAAFDTAVAEFLLDQGYVEVSDLDQETLVDYFYFRYYDCLDRIAQLPETDWDGLLNSIRDYHDRSRFHDAMYNLLHSPSGLTEDAAKCYRRLLYLENSDEGRTPISVTLMCESAMDQRYEADGSTPAFAGAGLVSCQTLSAARAADYPDFHGIHLEVYRVDYRYLCSHPEKVRTDGTIQVAGEWAIPAPDGSAYVLFEVKDDLHRVRLGDTDITGITPESDSAAFRKALEEYFRTEHPGELPDLGEDIRSGSGTPLALWDKGSYQAAADYLASYIGAFQTSSQQVLDGGWELWSYQKDDSWYLFLVGRDGRCAPLPLPVSDGSLRYAEPSTSYQSGGPVCWEARIAQTVYSAATGNLVQESGIYRYELDLDTLTLYESFTATESAAQDASFAARALSTGTCGKIRTELIAWLDAGTGAEVWQERFPAGRYWTSSDGAVAYLVFLSGTAHTEQYQLFLRFADGQEALLPLPNRPNSYAILTPSTASFEEDGTFTYDVDAGDLGQPGSVYRYTVDLSAKTVAMTVTKK